MLFIQPEYKYLLKGADMIGEYEIKVRSQNELFLLLHTSVVGKACKILGSLGNPFEKSLELLFLAHTLKKEGALHISLISPYMAYSRQDRNEHMQSYGLKWAYNMLQASGIDQIITIDLHKPDIQDEWFTRAHITNINPIPLWEPYFYQYLQQGYSFLLPDKGAYHRYGILLQEYPFAYLEKKRILDEVQILGIHGKVNAKVIIIDDILDTGKTLLQTCIALQKMGVQEIIIFITHGIFSDIIWHQIFSLNVKFIYCTNSLPEAILLQHPCIKIVSVRPLLESYFI